jgi:hypothetical protein
MFLRPVFLAILALFTLLGHNWARWLLVGFLAWRVAFSNWHLRPAQIALGFVLAFTFAYYLFRPSANPFFRGADTKGASNAHTQGPSTAP